MDNETFARYGEIAVRLTGLLRASVNRTPCPCSGMESITGKEWAELFELAARQGVLALVHDAVKDLPAEIKIPKPVALRWALSVEAIEERYRKQLAAAGRLSETLGAHGIRMMVLKGLGLSRYYPVPEHRECGDIDIYLFGDHAKCDDIVASLGIKTDFSHPKHSVFHFDGVMVENHATFTNRSNPYERKIEEFLLADTPHGMRRGPFLLPSAESHAVFLLRHTARHLGSREGITLRHLIDWALFLKTEGAAMDLAAVHAVAAETGHAALYDALTSVGGKLTGFEMSGLLISPPRREHEGLLLDAVMNTCDYHGNGKRNYLPRIAYKARKIYSVKRLSDNLVPDKFWRDMVLPRMAKFLTSRALNTKPSRESKRSK